MMHGLSWFWFPMMLFWLLLLGVVIYAAVWLANRDSGPSDGRYH